MGLHSWLSASLPQVGYGLLVVVLVLQVIFPVDAGKNRGGDKKGRVKVTAPAPSGVHWLRRNYTDFLSYQGHPWGCRIRAVDNNNWVCFDEVPEYSRHQRFFAEVIFDADDTCFQPPYMWSKADPTYAQLLELSGGGWGGVGYAGPVDSCGPTYTHISCVQHHLAKRVVKDDFFRRGPNATIQICQDGFNTGREAYVWLAADPRVNLVAFDIERNKTYVRNAAAMMTEKFGANRFQYIFGNKTQFLLPEFIKTHPNFPGCDIVSFTGAQETCDRLIAMWNLRRIVNEPNIVVHDNAACSSSWCLGGRAANMCQCGVTTIYYQLKVSYHETQHRAKHNGAFKIVNAPQICGFIIQAWNTSVPLPTENKPCGANLYD